MAYTAMSGTVLSTAKAITAVATDPYLPKVVNLALELKSLSKGEGPGVSLKDVVFPLKVLVQVKKRPWILPTVVVGVVGAIFAAGYFTRKVQKGGR